MKVFFLVILCLCFVLYVESRAIQKQSIVSIKKNRKTGQEPENPSNLPSAIIPFPSINSEAHSIIANEPSKLAGPLCILGGTLVHLSLGTLYCWGNFLSYAPQYLKFYDGLEHKGVQPDALIVLPLTILSMCVSMPLGPAVVNAIGASKTLLLGSWIMSAGVFLSSYAKNLYTFLAFYAILFGTGVGLAYTSPMVAGWKWLPSQKGLVSGVILTGFGAGGFFFNLIGTYLVNPKSLDLVNGKFPDEIYYNFPSMLRKLAVIYAVLQLVGALLVSEPKSQAVAPALKPGATPVPVVVAAGVSIVEALKTSQFWVIQMLATFCY